MFQKLPIGPSKPGGRQVGRVGQNANSHQKYIHKDLSANCELWIVIHNLFHLRNDTIFHVEFVGKKLRNVNVCNCNDIYRTILKFSSDPKL